MQFQEPVECVALDDAASHGRDLSILTVKGTQSICAINVPEWTEIEITIDSGACDTVMPASMCSHISMMTTPLTGLEYEVANGAGLRNLGERRCLMMTENSSLMKRLAFQCAAVHKPLLSVGMLADFGYECILGKDGGALRDTTTGDSIPLHRRENLYVMKAWVKQDHEQHPSPDFTRRG